jgi:predicted membrane-bound spermidine synthase
MAFVAGLIVLPPMLLLGATFPIVTRIAGAGHADAGRRVGLVYAANVCGAIVGSFVGGFVLLPELGAQASLLLLASLSMALAVVLAWASGVRAPAWRPAVAGGAAAVVAVGVLLAPDMFAGIFERRLLGQRVLFNDEGWRTWPQSRTTSTVRSASSTSTASRRRHGRGRGRLPSADRPHRIAAQARREAGAGDRLRRGHDAGGARHPGVAVEIVELSSAVTRAAPYFSAINGDVLTRPNVHLTVDDGRNFLLLSDTKYDVITADIIRRGTQARAISTPPSTSSWRGTRSPRTG